MYNVNTATLISLSSIITLPWNNRQLKIGTGKKIPYLPVLSKIAVCFGLSLSEFITIVESRIS